jgi:enoyl-CoA hydratase
MEHVRVVRDGALAEIVLDRPKVNAMSPALLRDVAAAFDEVADPAIAGVLLRGEGKALSAGLDLKEVATLDEASIDGFLDLLDRAFTAAFRYPRPLAVAVTGHAIAGGLVLALCGDYLSIARGEHKLGLTELAVGVPFPPVAFEIVRAGLPLRAFNRLVLEAEIHGAAASFEMGVGDALVDDAVADCRRWLGLVTSRPRAAFDYVKRQRREQVWNRLSAVPLAERRALVEAMLAARKELMG